MSGVVCGLPVGVVVTLLSTLVCYSAVTSFVKVLQKTDPVSGKSEWYSLSVETGCVTPVPTTGRRVPLHLPGASQEGTPCVPTPGAPSSVSPVTSVEEAEEGVQVLGHPPAKPCQVDFSHLGPLARKGLTVTRHVAEKPTNSEVGKLLRGYVRHYWETTHVSSVLGDGATCAVALRHALDPGCVGLIVVSLSAEIQVCGKAGPLR